MYNYFIDDRLKAGIFSSTFSGNQALASLRADQMLEQTPIDDVPNVNVASSSSD
jgi:hypothetical protein